MTLPPGRALPELDDLHAITNAVGPVHLPRIFDMCVLRPISCSLLIAFCCRYLPPPTRRGSPARSRSRHLRSADAGARRVPARQQGLSWRPGDEGHAASGSRPGNGAATARANTVYDVFSGLGRSEAARDTGAPGCPIRRGTVSRRRRRCPVPFGSGRPAGRTVRARPGRPRWSRSPRPGRRPARTAGTARPP